MSSPVRAAGPPPASHLYHADHYDWSRAPATFWHASGGPPPVAVDPLQGDVDAEVAIVGGGLTGLSAALHLARDHGIEARVLEAGPLGWGASGRNAGFCGPGGARRSLGWIARRFGSEAARQWYQLQVHAVELVRDLALRHRIDLRAAGEGEYVVAHTPRHIRMLERAAEEARAIAAAEWPLLSPAELRERGIALAEAYAALHLQPAFGLHPLRYLRGLARASIEYGARVHERTPVIEWRREGRLHRLVTPSGTVWAERVLFATDAYTPETLARELEGRTLPVLSAILVTRPLTVSEREAQGFLVPALVSDTRELLFYMRLLPDQRLLFGARGGLRADPASFLRRRAWLEARMRERFPAWRHVSVEYAWWGLVALARDGLPHLGPLPGLAGAWLAGCWHGSGVALATLAGRLAAFRLAGRTPDWPLPPFLAQVPPRFPLPGARPVILRLLYGCHLLGERLETFRATLAEARREREQR
ncbi:Gamma-glutamylputrescine oxidoreductase [bacterium HR40]|nr:Gamma-glutamylputrescine oxidoreductase [bacterium HR40]